MVYGGAPDHPERSAADWDLRPAMTLASRLIGVQELSPGDSVGYGSAFVAQRSMRVGTVACGYADGYPRHASGSGANGGIGGPVLVDGVRTTLLGRVSMDMLAVDLTPVEAAGRDARVGAEVVLWGRSAHGAVVGIDEVARAAGTIGYELMCAVAPRVPFAVD
jgi:alanine racemase